MCELRRCQQCAGGEEYAREEELQRQASVPGSRPSLGPLPPASPMALTDKHCTQVSAAGSLDDLRNPGGMSAAFAPGLWTQCGHGARRGPSRAPSHCHTTCSPSARENPPSRSATAAVHAARDTGLLAGPCCALPSPTASVLQLQAPPPAAGRQGCICLLLVEPGTLKGPSEVSRRGGDLGWDLGLS